MHFGNLVFCQCQLNHTRFILFPVLKAGIFCRVTVILMIDRVNSMTDRVNSVTDRVNS